MKLGRGGTALCATDSVRGPRGTCGVLRVNRMFSALSGCNRQHARRERRVVSIDTLPQPDFSDVARAARGQTAPHVRRSRLVTGVKHSLESSSKPHVPRTGWMEKGSACTHHLRVSGNRPAPRPWRRVQSDARIVHAWTALTEIPKVSFQRWGRLGATDAKDSDWDKSASLIIVIIVCLGRCWCAHQTNGKHRSDQQADAPGHD